MKLFTPGPTPIHPEVMKVLAQPMIHHRSEEFEKIVAEIRSDLAWLCGNAKGESVLFSSSGSGGMEAVVSSLFSPGDEVVVVEGGKFGERWVDLAKHYGLQTKIVSVEWGRSVEIDAILSEISPNTQAVLIQACESSTGVDHPVKKLGQALREHPQVLLVVDAITALGVYDLDMDQNHIDVLVGGSQKALMTPPGLATVSLSARAVDRLSGNESQSRYFSLQKELASERKNTTAYTPAVSLFRGLKEAFRVLRSEGKENLFKRTLLMQKMAREAFREMGLELFNLDEEATKGITVVKTPTGLDMKAWLASLKQEEGLWLAGGQGALAGKIFRISHMGAIYPENLLEAIETIEKNLVSVLVKAKDGKGTAVAKQIMEGKL